MPTAVIPGYAILRTYNDGARSGDIAKRWLTFTAPPIRSVLRRKSFETRPAPPDFLAGYLLMYLLERFLTAYVCDKAEMADYVLVHILFLGTGFHFFIDSIIYSASCTVGYFTGMLAAVGMALHRFPEGIIT